MLKYYARGLAFQGNSVVEPLFRIPLNQIESAFWVEVPDERPASQLIGKDNLINKITEEQQTRRPHCFEVKLKADYESLHLLNNVAGAIAKQHSASMKLKAKGQGSRNAVQRRLRMSRSEQDISLNVSQIHFTSPVSVRGPRPTTLLHQELSLPRSSII